MKDERITFTLMARRVPKETPLEVMQFTGTVMWCKLAKVKHGNTRFDAGVHFDPLDEESNYKLMMVLGGRVLELLPPVPADGEEAEEEDPDKPIVPGIDTSRLLRSNLSPRNKKAQEPEEDEDESTESDYNL